MARSWRTALLIIFIFAAAGAGLAVYHYKLPAQTQTAAAATSYKTPEETNNVYVRFEMEAFDSIQQNYWQKAADSDLANLFDLSVQKASNGTSTPTASDRGSTAKMLEQAFSQQKTAEDKKQLAVNTLIVALYNLAPVGRDELLSSQQETQLRQTVSNVNPNNDLYANVGAPDGATPDQVKTAFAQTKAALEASSSPTAKAQLAQAEYAEKVLTDANTKNRYDANKVEPTIFSHTLGDTLYLYIEKMSPTTLDEFVNALQAANNNKSLDSMIIDLRGNLGGALDIAPYFIGFWMGQNEYTFDLYHQGDYDVQRSPIAKIAELSRYRDVAVLTDNMTQSTAEVLTSALKKFKIAYSVGATTRGWGSVENTFPLKTTLDASTTYSLLLVHSLTLRPDNQPIEGHGVDPDVNTADHNWQSQLSTYFRSPSIISALEKEATKPPLKD